MIYNMNKEIIPAYMPEKFIDIEGATAAVRGEVKTIQLDLMDAKYVPEATWPFMFENDYNLEDLKNEKDGFPYWEDINYELDLMIERPESNIDTWLGIGASRVIFHYASVHDWEVIKNIDIVIRNFIDIGLAVTIHDDLEKIFPLIDKNVIDFIQVMGIAQIGFQGEPFDESSLEIIKTLRKKYPNLIISVDGGVSEDSIPDLCNAGADRLVSGSAVFGHGIVKENIQYLRDIAEGKIS